MQRAALPKPRARHRKPRKSDRVLIGLKVATVLAVTGLVGVLVLLITGTDAEPAARRPPTVPKITPDASGDDASQQVPSPAPPPTTIDPPALRTDTAEIAGQPATPSRPPEPTPRTKQGPRPDFEFAVIGERCQEEGAFSMTRDFRPVVCQPRPRSDRLRWAPVL